MKTILLFCISIGLTQANARQDQVEFYVRVLFEHARAQRVKTLEGMADEVKSKNNGTLNTAYLLALYIASPKKYEARFVKDFPVTSDGIMHDLYESIELKNVTPKFLFSFEALGRVAQRGNEKAIYKILNGVTHSDGVVSERFCEIVITLLRKQLKKTVAVLSRIGEVDRGKILQCSEDMEPGELAEIKKNLKKVKPSSEMEKIVIRDIQNWRK